MLSDADRQSIKAAFGADDAQVERDHLISHALAAISDDLGERIKFYGGQRSPARSCRWADSARTSTSSPSEHAPTSLRS